MKKFVPVLLCLLVLMLLVVVESNAQCAMCRAAVESNLKEKQMVGAGLNKGILYLMCIPYILFAVIAYIWYKSSRSKTVSQ